MPAVVGQKVEKVSKRAKRHRDRAGKRKIKGVRKRRSILGNGQASVLGRRLVSWSQAQAVAQAMGFGGGMPSPDQLKAMAEKMPGGLPPGGLPSLPKELPPGLRSGLPNLPGLTGLSGKPTLPGLGGFPGFGKKK